MKIIFDKVQNFGFPSLITADCNCVSLGYLLSFQVIFGARYLNPQLSATMAGFDLYSNALADILSEPTLSTPITVGLYAKWGSGKSFLLR